MIRLDALALSDALKAKEISAVELMESTLYRIAEVNETLNAVVCLRDADTLIADAKAMDSAPRTGWLHGIPIAIKDLANAKGLPTTKGSPLFKDNIAADDDIMVARLRAAGAIVIGKTNTPEFGLGSHTFNPVHGATPNPYDVTKTSGGSSGGAAVALSAGMLSVADGSDMMGSLRNPAAWNNVYGMRPSWGVVPSEPTGDIFMHMLSTLGPMARSPQDLAALLDTMAGRDPRQPHSLQINPTLPQINDTRAAPRIGWLGNWGGALPFEDGISDIALSALEVMTDMGWQVEEVPAPFYMDAIWQSWTDLRSFSVADGLIAHFENDAERAHLKDSAQWEIARGIGMSAQQVQAASTIRSDWFRAATSLFDTYDALVLPSTQVWPFDLTLEYPTEIAGQGMDTYHRWMQVVIPAGLIGLPVVNIPVGFGAAGLPAGLQLIGRHGTDAQMLQLAQMWHENTQWPQRRPGMP